MAKVTGEMSGVTGKVGNVTYYQKGGKTYVRKATSNSSRDMSAPNMVRVAENISEFREAAQWSKALRMVVRGLSRGSIAGLLTAELLAMAKQYDTRNTRGQRSIKDVQGIGLSNLIGFELNPKTTLDSVMLGGNMTSDITPNDFSVTYQDFTLNAPQGATHWVMVVLVASFENETKRVKSLATSSQNPVALTANNVVSASSHSTDPLPPFATGDLLLGVVAFSFFQEVNGVMYKLNEGQKNPARVMEFTRA